MFIIVFILTILILVVIHELGHFLAAKKFNIKVLEFGFGIPPRVFGKKLGETLVSLNWLPFGGFVRLLGEDEVDKETLENRRSFAYQNVYKRIVVVAAGVLMNLLLAFLLYYVVVASQNFQVQMPLLTSHKFVGVNQKNEQLVVIGEVSKNSPAWEAGLKPSDRVLAINGQPIANVEELIVKTREQAGKEVSLQVSDIQKQNQRTLKVTPRLNPPKGEGALGVALSGFEVATLSYDTPAQRVFAGPIHSYNLASYSMEILSKTIGTAFAKKDLTPVSKTVSGPVGITSIVKDILSIKNPLIPYLDFMAALSLNLALVNVLPFPGLDGGRLLFLFIEAVTKRRVHAEAEKWIHTAGMAILLALIILITLSDIKRLFS